MVGFYGNIRNIEQKFGQRKYHQLDFTEISRNIINIEQKFGQKISIE